LKDHELTPREERRKSDDDLRRNAAENPFANAAPKTWISSVPWQTGGIRCLASARDCDKAAEKATRRGERAVFRPSGGRLP
jgi:hypothetical protein